MTLDERSGSVWDLNISAGPRGGGGAEGHVPPEEAMSALKKREKKLFFIYC